MIERLTVHCCSVSGLELFRVALYLAVPVGCVWLYNQPAVNALIQRRVSQQHTAHYLTVLY